MLNINIIINKFKTQTCLDLKFHTHTQQQADKLGLRNRGQGSGGETVADAAAFAAGVNRIIKRKLSPSRAEKWHFRTKGDDDGDEWKPTQTRQTRKKA